MKTLNTIELVDNRLIGHRCIRVYKKIVSDGMYSIAVLNIPMYMGTFIHLSSRKCRASQAYVERIESVKKSKKTGEYRQLTRGKSIWDREFTYTVGEWIEPKKKFSTVADDCASGIHFFLTRREAENYVM